MSSDAGTPPTSWRMAPQGYRVQDFWLKTEPVGDGYVMTICIGWQQRRVFFDAAGRITYVRATDGFQFD